DRHRGRYRYVADPMQRDCHDPALTLERRGGGLEQLVPQVAFEDRLVVHALELGVDQLVDGANAGVVGRQRDPPPGGGKDHAECGGLRHAHDSLPSVTSTSAVIASASASSSSERDRFAVQKVSSRASREPGGKIV